MPWVRGRGVLGRGAGAKMGVCHMCIACVSRTASSSSRSIYAARLLPVASEFELVRVPHEAGLHAFESGAERVGEATGRMAVVKLQ